MRDGEDSAVAWGAAWWLMRESVGGYGRVREREREVTNNKTGVRLKPEGGQLSQQRRECRRFQSRARTRRDYIYQNERGKETRDKAGGIYIYGKEWGGG